MSRANVYFFAFILGFAITTIILQIMKAVSMSTGDCIFFLIMVVAVLVAVVVWRSQ